MAFHMSKLYVTSLAEKSIRMLTTDGETINDQGIVFEAIEGRIRDIAVGRDNHLYVLTDGDQAELIKITQTLSR
jgi:glucose/arabinose dehydrogenase